MKTKFGYAKFEKGMHFILKGVEYVVDYFGYVKYNEPFCLFGGADGVITTTGEVLHRPRFFNDEIEIVD